MCALLLWLGKKRKLVTNEQTEEEMGGYESDALHMSLSTEFCCLDVESRRSGEGKLSLELLLVLLLRGSSRNTGTYLVN
jgi:hypothetical protein